MLAVARGKSTSQNRVHVETSEGALRSLPGQKEQNGHSSQRQNSHCKVMIRIIVVLDFSQILNWHQHIFNPTLKSEQSFCPRLPPDEKPEDRARPHDAQTARGNVQARKTGGRYLTERNILDSSAAINKKIPSCYSGQRNSICLFSFTYLRRQCSRRMRCNSR